MPKCGDCEFIVTARCEFSGWPEGCALTKADSKHVGDFLWRDVVCRHGAFHRLIIDGGPENKGFVEALTKRVGIYRLRISAYNSKANGGIEGNHNDMRNALAKMDGPWKDNLPAVLFAQRTSVKSSTGFTPYYLLFGEEAILPLEITVPT